MLGVLDVLRQREVAVVFVTHILEEVMQLSDVVTILRDGRVVLDAASRSTLSIDSIVHAMLGERLIAEETTAPLVPPAADAPALVIDRLTVRGLLHDAGLTARGGEVGGLAAPARVVPHTIP